MEELTSNIPELIDYLFKGVIAIGLYHFKDIKKSMETMTESINKLNLQVARMFEKHDTKEKQIEIINETLHRLEGENKTLREKMHEINNNYTPKIQMHDEKFKGIHVRLDSVERRVK